MQPMTKIQIKQAMLVVLAVCFVGAQGAAGQDAAKLRDALNNAQAEMIQCAAYFDVVAACLAVSNKEPSTIEAYQRHSQELMLNGHKLSELTGITDDAMMSRYKIAHQDHMTLLRSSCVNISSLYSR